MAWRDSRRSRSRLLLFTASIVLGIAALVAINSFKENLENDINHQAKDLLGADLVIYGNQPATDSLIWLFDSLGGERSLEKSFASMILFPKNDGARLVNVRAITGNFPYYGAIETNPQPAQYVFRSGQKALVDKTLMMQYEISNGDSVQVGNLVFKIEGEIENLPGQTGISATVAPPVYIPLEFLEETGLETKGSRINYRYYFKFEDGRDIDGLVEAIENRLDDEAMRYDTVESRKESVGRTFENLARFLNLVGFIALLLGCVGVASSVHIYVKEKLDSVAVLRCIGAKGNQAFIIYLFQIVLMGVIGSATGVTIGSLVQTVLPEIFGDFLPLQVQVSLSWSAIFQGFLTGIAISILFALLPLIAIRKTSPLRTLRASYEPPQLKYDPIRWLVILAIGAFIFGFSYWQIQEWTESIIFSLSIGLAFLLLAGLAKLVMWLIRKYFPSRWGYISRQSLANLYRPNNQTVILMVSIGLGTALITTLFFVQDLLIKKVRFSGSDEQPNMVLFDIQTDQKDEVADLARQFELPIIQQVPIVTMRLLKTNGLTKQDVEADSTLDIPTWPFRREYRVTYRDSLISSEETVRGNWDGVMDKGGDSIFISLDERHAEDLNLDIGDPVVFNVQGALVETYLGHTREVDWQRVQTNFLVVFPMGVLEKAPQFHVLMTRADSEKVSANFQRALVKNYPNISVIDLALILSTLDNILDKIAFVIRFMALFSIITGLIVLVSSVIISKFQRIRESVLLRTLGAHKRQIFRINALEYFFLGSLASASGILISLVGSWALAYFNFELEFIPDFIPMIAVYLIITGITVAIGLLNHRAIVQKPPLEILREEV